MSDRALTIVEGWRDRLAAAGLNTLDALLTLDRGRVRSAHDRGRLREVELPDGGTVFVKCALSTTFKQVAGDLMSFRHPEPLSEKERVGIERARALGIVTAEVIAWGQRRRGGWPWQGVLVMDRLAGVPLNAWLAAGPEAPRRRAVLGDVGRTIAALYRGGFSWPDLRVKHIFVDEDGRIGLLDLERLRPCRWAVRRWLPGHVRRLCRALRDAGADEGDLAALRDGLSRRG